MRRALIAAAVVAIAGPAFAQRAPRETVTATLNGKKVAVEYGRPALSGRTVGELLSRLPEDRIWRAGVDQATTLTAETDVMIGTTRVPAGKYTVYLYAPVNAPYALVLNSDKGVALKTIFAGASADVADALWPRPSYEPIKATEVARIPLSSVKAKEPMERFLIALDPAVGGASALTMTWGDQAWSVPVKPAAAATKR